MITEPTPRITEPTPRSWRAAERPDRVMAAYRYVVSGYAALARRGRRTGPTPTDRTLALTVTRKRAEAAGVVGLRLAPATGAALPAWDPGAHLDLVLPSGRRRQYSLCGDPADVSGYEIAVRRIPDGAGSVEIHDELAEGDTVSALGPRNAFPFAHPSLARADLDNVVFVAGGIGITPILPMVAAAAATGVDWHLTYFGRDRDTMPFLDRLSGYGGRVRVLTDADAGCPDLPTLLSAARPGSAVYFCGPPALLPGLRDAFAATGASGLHYERFSAPPVTGGRPFDVHLARTGTTLHVPADRSALDVAREALPGVAYSCRQGFCGTCRVPVVDGQVRRLGRSGFLAAPDTMLLCSDRAGGPELTLDL